MSQTIPYIQDCQSITSAEELDNLVNKPEASICLGCKNPSWICGWYGGWCTPNTFQRTCHFYQENLCPDKNCGCCFSKNCYIKVVL